jgi:hypothetical protein
MGTDPAGFAYKNGSKRFFDRVFDAGNIRHEGGGGEERKKGTGQCSEGGRRRSQENKIGTGYEGEICAHLGLGKGGSDGGK